MPGRGGSRSLSPRELPLPSRWLRVLESRDSVTPIPTVISSMHGSFGNRALRFETILFFRLPFLPIPERICGGAFICCSFPSPHLEIFGEGDWPARRLPRFSGERARISSIAPHSGARRSLLFCRLLPRRCFLIATTS